MPIDPLDDLPNWVAVKVVYDNRNLPPHDIEREAAILKRIHHPNVSIPDNTSSLLASLNAR